MRSSTSNRESKKWQTAARSASRTCRWAKTMTSWLIDWSRSKGARWHIMDFVGPNRCESRGIVDLLAVRKNHAVQSDVLKRGDILDIVLIQVKGGNARFPTQEDVERLKKVARYHKAKAVVLSEWKRGKCPQLYLLKRNKWSPIEPQEVF